MPLPISPFPLKIAAEIAAYYRDRGYWASCTPEDIMRLADSYDELHVWEQNVWAYYKKEDRYFSLDEVTNPQDGQFAVIVMGQKRIIRYKYQNGEWVYMQDELTS
ncbi:hypothetical protein [Paenibacillus sp. UASWS1643]|uniref:hypothetical protein n=1 Tax=Paenibacillus sp. UASWS1643 TaxID=2580422 RepID=UPI0012392673|nr:hypothetical protein [Paenibacillus sp. UASWS1643]KAA8747093.1 hypothetical protein FE296_23185 [Paenibacillus sp. UASWS1643]